jgi:hypothetical protein
MQKLTPRGDVSPDQAKQSHHKLLREIVYAF